MARMERDDVVSVLREPGMYKPEIARKAAILACHLLKRDVREIKRRDEKISKQWGIIKKLRKEIGQLP